MLPTDISVFSIIGREVREQLFSQVTSLFHDLDMGMLPISVLLPYLPIPAHNRRDRLTYSVCLLIWCTSAIQHCMTIDPGCTPAGQKAKLNVSYCDCAAYWSVSNIYSKSLICTLQVFCQEHCRYSEFICRGCACVEYTWFLFCKGQLANRPCF